MDTAQEHLKDTASGETRGGFNSRLQGFSLLETVEGVPSGSRWAQRNAGWELADGMIRKGKIYSMLKTDKGSIEFKCFPDGEAWCCVGAGFEDLQGSSNYSFGDSWQKAVDNFKNMMMP